MQRALDRSKGYPQHLERRIRGELASSASVCARRKFGSVDEVLASMPSIGIPRQQVAARVESERVETRGKSRSIP